VKLIGRRGLRIGAPSAAAGARPFHQVGAKAREHQAITTIGWRSSYFGLPEHEPENLEFFQTLPAYRRPGSNHAVLSRDDAVVRAPSFEATVGAA
jgi:hypothetical protein